MASILEQYGSIRDRLGALRYARRGKRWRLLSYSFRPLPRPSEPLRCEVSRLEEYDSAVATISRYVAAERRGVQPVNCESLQRLIDANRSSSGAIGVGDLLFLHAFVTVLAPPRVVEVGTLTGFSASVIAAAAAQQQLTTTGIVVETIDLNRWCITDMTKPVGFEIAHLVPELAPRIRVHSGKDARYVAEIAAKGELPLIFIDADHQHPRPTLDLLRVAPFVKSAGWVILHDIDLARVTEQMRGAGVEPDFEPSRGAQWLFDAWPFGKISGGNIGAVQLPAKPRDLLPFVLAMLRIPSELTGVSAQRTAEALLTEASKLATLGEY
jgi:predicted O-methyltransferase YrrM